MKVSGGAGKISNPYEAKFTKYSRMEDIYSPSNVIKNGYGKLLRKTLINEGQGEGRVSSESKVK